MKSGQTGQVELGESVEMVVDPATAFGRMIKPLIYTESMDIGGDGNPVGQEVPGGGFVEPGQIWLPKDSMEGGEPQFPLGYMEDDVILE